MRYHLRNWVAAAIVVLALAVLGFAQAPAPATGVFVAAPTPSGGCSPSPCIAAVTGGTLTDGETNVVITGLGFGTKSTAAPAMWDDATSGNINTKGYDDVYQVNYSTGLNGVAMPHSHATHYIAGVDTVGNGGMDVAKVVQLGSIPGWAYVTFYFHMGPNWVYAGGNDDNVKWFVWTPECCAPLGGSLYWYDNFDPERWTNGMGTDDLPNGTGPHPHATALDVTSFWAHKRYLIRAASDATGRIITWENGTQRYDYTGGNDHGSGQGTQRLIAIGGYARPYSGDSDQNSFHFADVYIDPTAAHVEIANTSNFTTAPRWATQIPTAWSSTSVTITVNLGELSSETAYIRVCDSTFTCTPGFAVPVGP